jgi:hypothetical protein
MLIDGFDLFMQFALSLAAAIGFGCGFALSAPTWVVMLTGFQEVLFLQITANTVLTVYLPELFPTDVRGTGFGAATAAGCESAAIMLYFCTVCTKRLRYPRSIRYAILHAARAVPADIRVRARDEPQEAGGR